MRTHRSDAWAKLESIECRYQRERRWTFPLRWKEKICRSRSCRWTNRCTCTGNLWDESNLKSSGCLLKLLVKITVLRAEFYSPADFNSNGFSHSCSVRLKRENPSCKLHANRRSPRKYQRLASAFAGLKPRNASSRWAALKANASSRKISPFARRLALSAT